MIRVVSSIRDTGTVDRPVVFAAGAFDGVHRGHQAVFRAAIDLAASCHGEAWALSFDPHPLKVLRPESAPPLITSTPHRLRLLAETGIRGVVLIPFNEAMASLEPESFIFAVREQTPRLHAFVVGENWTFGRRASGDVALLRKLGARFGFDVVAVPRVQWNGAPISSTRIRQAVREGDLAAAEAMLGRPFSMFGTVIHGAKIGRQLGYPTANVDPHNEVRPPPGVYACRTRVDGRVYPSAAFLAARPDPRKGPPDLVEVHLLDVSLDLYGRDIDVEFVKKLRDEWQFESVDVLKTQIARDCEEARAVLSA
ncbi:MAG: riboflavin biosynthesis protein RibF [Kiritimatiellae bacterium]|nr:riboflavin biosynthesis protein RibF [Kiritimatiellia bacterium]MDW8457838.1 riboflavin biosynthesis protein RibF [Verrucomicrobiota bacterium]